MEPVQSFELEWPYLLTFFPPEAALEETANSYGAMTRKRAVDSASTLLRLALVYGFCGYSLRETAAWAEAAEIASLSDVALLKRLRNASDWLGFLLGRKLAERAGPVPADQSRVRLIDASVITAPGKSDRHSWRVHLDFDLGAQSISGIQVTQVEGGESLRRFEFEPGDLIVADRGYAHRPGLAQVHAAGARFIVRLNQASVPLQMPGGETFDLLSAVRGLPDAQAQSFDVETQPDPKNNIPAIPVRLVAIRKTEQAAREARKKRLRKASQSRHKSVQPETLELAGYILVITSTSEDDLSAEQILDIYRFRWQIEIVFKRLKSLLEIDRLPAKNPQLARTFLYSKLLAALVVEELTLTYISFSPWGYRLRPPALHLAHPTHDSRTLAPHHLGGVAHLPMAP